MNLVGKVAIVTGGVSGIGLAIVKNYLKSGAYVVASDINDNGVNIINELNNQNCTFFKADVSSESDIINLVNYTVNKYGKLDIMVANAGIGDGSPIGDETTEYWDKVININLRGVFLSNKYAINEMLKNANGGVIINMSSVLGLCGEAIAPAYCACKAGIINLTRSGALAYASKNIRINAIAPGYIKTPLIASIDEEFLIKKHPIGRLGEDYEVASVANFLASDGASFIHGVTIPVDGGYTAI